MSGSDMSLLLLALVVAVVLLSWLLCNSGRQRAYRRGLHDGGNCEGYLIAKDIHNRGGSARLTGRVDDEGWSFEVWDDAEIRSVDDDRR